MSPVIEKILFKWKLLKRNHFSVMSTFDIYLHLPLYCTCTKDEGCDIGYNLVVTHVEQNCKEYLSNNFSMHAKKTKQMCTFIYGNKTA